jgi:hypothetical protein
MAKQTAQKKASKVISKAIAKKKQSIKKAIVSENRRSASGRIKRVRNAQKKSDKAGQTAQKKASSIIKKALEKENREKKAKADSRRQAQKDRRAARAEKIKKGKGLPEEQKPRFPSPASNVPGKVIRRSGLVGAIASLLHSKSLNKGEEAALKRMRAKYKAAGEKKGKPTSPRKRKK